MNEMLIEHYMVQIKEKQNSTLTEKLHDVNMRLYNNNKEYKFVVRTAMELLSRVLWMKFTNYPPIKGVSGANLGIPFNIIATKMGNVSKQMINPKIIKREGRKIETLSNCGSLLLPKNVTVLRDELVEVMCYDLNGNKQIEKFSREQFGFTIQHEIDHNLGITITDLRTK